MFQWQRRGRRELFLPTDGRGDGLRRQLVEGLAAEGFEDRVEVRLARADVPGLELVESGKRGGWTRHVRKVERLGLRRIAVQQNRTRRLCVEGASGHRLRPCSRAAWTVYIVRA